MKAAREIKAGKSRVEAGALDLTPEGMVLVEAFLAAHDDLEIVIKRGDARSTAAPDS